MYLQCESPTQEHVGTEGRVQTLQRTVIVRSQEMVASGKIFFHYDNTLMQYTAIFIGCKDDKF